MARELPRHDGLGAFVFQVSPIFCVLIIAAAVAMCGIVKVSVDGERLVAWYREIEALKKSQFVAQIGRFSNPPRIEDLEPLTLDETDLDDIRRCTPGDCGLKLSDAEISHLRE